MPGEKLREVYSTGDAVDSYRCSRNGGRGGGRNDGARRPGNEVDVMNR